MLKIDLIYIRKSQELIFQFPGVSKCTRRLWCILREENLGKIICFQLVIHDIAKDYNKQLC